MRTAAFATAALSCAALFAASHWNGGRTVPVHRLAPRDASGDAVSLAADHQNPMSLAKTCGQCHDAAALRGGTHFRTGLSAGEAAPTTPGEPWFLADDATGTCIPLSLHGQKGAYRPADLGISCWGWTKLFGRHFPGGGIASDPAAMEEEAGAAQRWFVTGPLEANCLACHQRTGYDSSEWARQVLRENWSGAATAASGLADVGGMNERLESTWTARENPDDHLFKVPQKTEYDLSKFNSKGRCVFDVGKPENANCLACHGVSQKGVPSHALADDVHLSRGMKCTDCHKNGMDHRVATTSCASCHVGKGGAGPKPDHKGMPLVHFKKLSCTVCHAGATEGGKPALVRTPRANRIGVYGRAQWATDNPYVLEPVFAKNADGVIEPVRMVWPSGMREEKEGRLLPLKPEEAAKLGGDAFTVVERVDGILELLKEMNGPLGKVALTEKGEIVYSTGTNDIALVAAEDRYQGEFKNLLATLFNAKVGVSKDRVAAVRGGKVWTIDKSGAVAEVADAAKPEEGAMPVGTLSADGKAFVPAADRWTVEQYLKVKNAEKPLTKEMVKRALANAAKSAPGRKFAFLSAGAAFTLGEGGGLAAKEGAPEAQPVSWPIGHNVRAARMARGAAPAKCADCHGGGSSFFLSEVRPEGPVQDAGAAPKPQAEYMDVSGGYHSLLGMTFSLRPALKLFMWSAFCVLALFGAAFAGSALVRISREFSAKTDSFAWGFFKWLLDIGMACSVAYLALSGVLGWMAGEMTGIWIMLHMCAGGFFTGCFALRLFLKRGCSCERCFAGEAIRAGLLVLAAATVFTAVMPMMTVFGEEGQLWLLWAHRVSSLAFAALAAFALKRAFGKRR